MGESYGAMGSCMSGLTDSYRIVAHNLANANTVGFKRSLSIFMEEVMGREIGQSPQTGRVGQTAAVDFSPGSLVYSGRPLDLAVGGKGFFVLETDTGELYTRNGSFTINHRRQLTDSSGRLVAGSNGPVTLPPTVASADVAVSHEGVLTAHGRRIGQVKVVEFPNMQALNPIGGGCFKTVGQVKTEPAKDAKIQQGFQEASNVNPIEELVNLVTMTRLYEANAKAIQAVDDRLDSLNRVVL